MIMVRVVLGVKKDGFRSLVMHHELWSEIEYERGLYLLSDRRFVSCFHGENYDVT